MILQERCDVENQIKLHITDMMVVSLCKSRVKHQIIILYHIAIKCDYDYCVHGKVIFVMISISQNANKP